MALYLFLCLFGATLCLWYTVVQRSWGLELQRENTLWDDAGPQKKKQFSLDLWFKKTQLSLSPSFVPWEVRYGCHQNKVSGPQQLWWSNMTQRHEAQPKCSASDAGTARILFSPPKKLPMIDRLRPSYLYYSPSRQLSMCWLSTHTRWESIALLFTLTITWKIGDMLSKGIHPARFRLQLAFCAVAKEQLNHMWAWFWQKQRCCSVQTPRMTESGWRE